MSGGRIVISGIGAVSAAGWGVEALAKAVAAGASLPVETLEREHASGKTASLVRRVPPPAAGDLPKFPRLRRSSPISRFAAAAAVQAIGEEKAAAFRNGERRLGVVMAMMNGCVNYSNRFYGEVLTEAAVPSPLIFPETVFNAPASHLSAFFGATGPSNTILGDSSVFLAGIEMAAEWIEDGRVDACLVVGSEELDWLGSEGLAFYGDGLVATEGAGAVLLERGNDGVLLDLVTDPVPLETRRDVTAAVGRVRRELGEADAETLLVDSCTGVGWSDRGEETVWIDWPGPRLSPRRLLGEPMGASAALQTVLAVKALQDGSSPRAFVCATGGNEQVLGTGLRRKGVDQPCRERLEEKPDTDEGAREMVRDD